MFGNSVAIIEGHDGISEYCSERVSFLLCKEVLEICGTSLQIKCLEQNYAVVIGKIISVSVKNA